MGVFSMDEPVFNYEFPIPMQDNNMLHVEDLMELIDRTAAHWLSIDGIPWEGGIDAAMEAAVGEIERLREMMVMTDDRLENLARIIAAGRLGLVKDTRGVHLPKEIWQPYTLTAQIVWAEFTRDL